MWNKIQIWQLVTSIPKSEQGIVILLESLEHDVKAQKTACDFTINELNSDEGMKILMNKLDSIFQNETTDEAYEAYIKFLNLTRKDHCDMSDYVLEFENLYKHGKEFRMNMLDPVLVFEHLDGPNAANNDCKLALALGKDTKLITRNMHLNVYLANYLPHCHYYWLHQPVILKKRKPFMQS